MNLAELSWPQVEQLSRDLPVVIPIAAIEQHGHHLPIATDSMLLAEIIRRASLTLQDVAVVTPLVWFGNSQHHLDFPGTLTASPRVYLDMMTDLVENMITHGFKRILLINGHGGNIIPGKQVLFEVRQRHRRRDDLLLLFASYWDTAAPATLRADFVQPMVDHACEWETSMMLALAPQLVGDYRSAVTIPNGSGFEPGHRAWTTRDRSNTGHIGSPQHATAEKGEFLLTCFADGVTSLIRTAAAWDGSSWFANSTVSRVE